MASHQQTDPLYPLASLHWEHCCEPLWSYQNPTHCAALQDKVAILTSHRNQCDELLISSDLRKWTTIGLQYFNMSLTVYQSKFVLVGGRSSSTIEPTNIVLTSTTGEEWEPSLPPMPTKRYDTSSVSTRSPEVLVVAGGVGVGSRLLDVVEVFKDDQWTTANPLLAPCHNVHSTFHDGILYFTRGTYQRATILYTCSCASLISSCEKSSSHTSNSQLWRELRAPWSTAIISHSSRLISIGNIGRVECYSSTHNSWVEATSEGDTRHIYSSPTAAACILPTGDIVYAQEYGGIYRVTVSVSAYSPNIQFPRNALIRLEVMMGIEIVSVLAKHSTRLASSALELKHEDKYGNVITLPDPQAQPHEYVIEVISQWSAGNCYNPPTWGELLDVLQDIDLSQLAQLIEDFMKGGVRYMDAYHHFISTKAVLEMLFLKILFSGPPRLGKSTSLRRLMGEIIDLLSAGEADQVHPSTGAVEVKPDMIVKKVSSSTAVVTEAEWCAVESHTDEARMLLYNFADSLGERNNPTSTPARATEVRTVGEATTATPTTNSSRHLGSSRPLKKQTLGGFSKFRSTMKERMKRIPSYFYRSTPISVPEVEQLFHEAIKQPEFWEDAKKSFRAFLRIEDTGGQPELMDMLPALTIGPGLFLVFFNLEWSLKKEFRVFYQHSSGKTTTPEESKITLEEMLLSTLSSISCSSASANQLGGKKVKSMDMREILESSRSVAYLVGTHKDKVSEEHISQLDEELQSIIRGTDFFEKGIVQFCSEGKLIVTLDNMKGGEEEVKEFKRILQRVMEQQYKKLKIPARWLLFSLNLRENNVRTVDINSTLHLSRQFKMSAYETKVALWFLHHHAGVLMYFPDVDLLQDLVILDSQVVYDSVTELILRSMSFDNVGQARAEKFRETGRFVLEDLVAATGHVSGGDLIPPEKLIALLEFLHIIASIVPVQHSASSTKKKQDLVHLMPCVLPIASKEKLDAICEDQSRPQCVAPLMIRYKCGFVPLGIFPALIASLIVDKSFELIEKEMMKNIVRFRFGPCKTHVTFLSYPKFYVILISELLVAEHEIHEECVALRNVVVAALEKVSSHMNYGFFLDYQFAFECPSHPGREHLCVVDSESNTPKIMSCYKDQKEKKSVRMVSVHRVWYNEPILLSSTGTRTKAAGLSGCSVPGLRCDNLLRIFGDEFPPSKAKELGTYLNIPSGKLDEFRHNNMGDVKGMLIDVLTYWLETDPRKSWSKLAEAVEDCDHRVVAEKLRSTNQYGHQ